MVFDYSDPLSLEKALHCYSDLKYQKEILQNEFSFFAISSNCQPNTNGLPQSLKQNLGVHTFMLNPKDKSSIENAFFAHAQQMVRAAHSGMVKYRSKKSISSFKQAFFFIHSGYLYYAPGPKTPHHHKTKRIPLTYQGGLIDIVWSAHKDACQVQIHTKQKTVFLLATDLDQAREWALRLFDYANGCKDVISPEEFTAFVSKLKVKMARVASLHEIVVDQSV
eukprot:TRINITY_DN4209_c0_g1::TRINITY_DN4209_c0_g1_i1::g.7999::m.7999 TRINITY_DN4209_c0_g1::TRINITY_DN4209_c0_g1_i1::g.7999  ORF type:complete len:256 (+),score=61.35,PH/PF00169.24/9.9e+02,PH/PF00169.24/5.9e-05,Rapamycin_bind/PF08771.6/0.25 TRINITY_DN4209_c0_g1_i1:104-769(+)